jgi:hypothetical protein
LRKAANAVIEGLDDTTRVPGRILRQIRTAALDYVEHG